VIVSAKTLAPARQSIGGLEVIDCRTILARLLPPATVKDVAPSFTVLILARNIAQRPVKLPFGCGILGRFSQNLVRYAARNSRLSRNVPTKGIVLKSATSQLT
jgi:hypothetical protein